jgi:hypothetical protein
MSVSTHRRPRTRVAITARRLGIGVAVLVALLMAPVTVFGHTGSITASENCETFDVRVFLNNDVKSDHVTVTTTIPGTTGFENRSFDTTGRTTPLEILHLSGDAPKSGTVTLKIGTEFTASETIQPPSDCAQPAPTPVPTPEATPVATPVATPEATPVATPEATPVATPVATPAATPGGGVGGVTGTPRPVVTLPPTDSAAMPAASGEPSIVAVLFVMVAASAIATVALRPRKGVRVRNR